jgi:hypothetical protein
MCRKGISILAGARHVSAIGAKWPLAWRRATQYPISIKEYPITKLPFFKPIR